jgi:hypothetical protein
MSFEPRDLSVLAYANGFTHWHYRTRDPLATLGGDYFAAAAELLRAGDQITVTLLAGEQAELAIFAVVAAQPAPRLTLLISSAPTQLDQLARAA